MQKVIRHITKNKWTFFFIRLGHIIRGVLYGLVGVIALRVAIGLSRDALSVKGVIGMISTLYLGRFLLTLLIVGVGGYSLWSLIRSFIKNASFLQKTGYVLSSLYYASLIGTGITILFHIEKLEKDDSLYKTSSFIISMPMGNIILVCIGAGTIIGGLFQVLKAIQAHKPSDLWCENLDQKYKIPFMIFAKIGITIRGIIFALVGFFIIVAALYADPSQAKGIDDVFKFVHHAYGGSILLAIAGIGLIFFGLYSSLLSLWIRMPENV